MKIFNIFVASSIVTFSKERKRLAAYFCDLNNAMTETGIFFDVKFCEELDNAVPEARKQDEYNSYIDSSDLVLFLVASDCGDYTFEEFRVAFHSVHNPRIVVFSLNTVNELSSKVLFMREKTVSNAVQFISYNEYNQLEDQVRDLVKNLVEKSSPSGMQPPDDLNKISFFLGASSVENEDERNEILRFVLGLNAKLLHTGTYVQVAPCGDNASGESSIDIQQTHENLISNSDTAFFVFFSKADSLTERDLLFAASQFKQTGSPKIYTYFIDQAEDDGSIVRVKCYIDQTLNHYYSIFSSVDSIKLSILLRLSDQNAMPLSVKDSSIVTHEEALLDVTGLDIFSQNKILGQHKRRLSDLTNQYKTVAGEFSLDHNRRDLLKLLSDLDDAITELKDTIRQEENEALSMLCDMHRNVAKGEMSELMKKAYRLLEKGMIEEAAEILNKEIVDSYYGSRLTDQIVALKSEVDDAIEMYRHTIHIQKMLEESEETVNTIIACYDTIMQYLPMANPSTYALAMEYAQFLDQQNNPAAESIFMKAEYLLNNPEHNVHPEILAQLYSSMGKYYLHQHNSEMSTKYLEKYYLIAQNLYNSNEEKYALFYSQSCLNYAQIGAKGKTNIVEHGLSVIRKFYASASHSSQSTYAVDMANYYYLRGNFYGSIFDYHHNLEFYGTMTEELHETNCSASDHRNTAQKSGETVVNLVKTHSHQKGLLADDNCAVAIESYKTAAELLERHSIRDGLLADIYNGVAEIMRRGDRGKVSERIVKRYYDNAQTILEGLYTKDPDTYADALGTVYNNKFVFYLDYGERYYQGLQCLKASESVYSYLYQINPRKNGLGLAECYMQLSNVYDSLGNKKRAVDYAHKGVELLEGLVEINYDRYADKLAWAYSELGLLCNLYNDDILASNYLRKSLDVLEASEYANFQQSQVEIISKMLVAVQLMIKQNNEGTNEAIYDLADRVFRFIYVYVKPTFADSLEFNGTLYSIGEMLLYHFDSVDHEKTMQFYYPAVTELGKKRRADPSVTEEEKMFINLTLASIAGLSGDTVKSESYFHACLDSFERTDSYQKLKPSKKRKGAKKIHKKKKRLDRRLKIADLLH